MRGALWLLEALVAAIFLLLFTPRIPGYCEAFYGNPAVELAVQSAENQVFYVQTRIACAGYFVSVAEGMAILPDDLPRMELECATVGRESLRAAYEKRQVELEGLRRRGEALAREAAARRRQQEEENIFGYLEYGLQPPRFTDEGLREKWGIEPALARRLYRVWYKRKASEDPNYKGPHPDCPVPCKAP